MTEITENSVQQETAVLVGLDTGEYDADVSIQELAALAEAAGAQVLLSVTQRRERPEAATCVGIGKLFEIKAACELQGATLLIFDCELTPSQQRNIEKITSVRTVDRTMLILDIFAQRARSGEGRVQVELAQLRYSLPRLSGLGTELSRLGGGIGTRGPGETKLETDKRHIRRRIAHLEQELEQLEKRRLMQRERRKKNGVECVAIVGYTNAGKSSLMNALTDAGVLAQDMLFATLDTTSRALTLPDGRKILLVDTVGLIRRLPHKLVEAFKSTLEIAADASVILNVCDASDEQCNEHISVTSSLLDEIGCAGIPVITVMNKCDLAGDIYHLPTFGKTVMISATQKRGLDTLLNMISDTLPPTRTTVELLIPFANGAQAAQIRREGNVITEEYRADGLYMKATVENTFLDEHRDWIIT